MHSPAASVKALRAHFFALGVQSLLPRSMAFYFLENISEFVKLTFTLFHIISGYAQLFFMSIYSTIYIHIQYYFNLVE